MKMNKILILVMCALFAGPLFAAVDTTVNTEGGYNRKDGTYSVQPQTRPAPTSTINTKGTVNTSPKSTPTTPTINKPAVGQEGIPADNNTWK